MLEVLESRINHAKRNVKRYQEYPHLLPHLLESVVYQLELALTDIAGFRLAHPEVKDESVQVREVRLLEGADPL